MTPMRPHSRFIGCSATPKPASRSLSASIRSPLPEDRRKPARGQVHVEQLVEERDRSPRESTRPIAALRAQRRLPNPRAHAHEERGARDHEPCPADERRDGRTGRRSPTGKRRARTTSVCSVRLRQPPLKASYDSHRPSRMSPPPTTAGMKLGPILAYPPSEGRVAVTAATTMPSARTPGQRDLGARPAHLAWPRSTSSSQASR